MKTTTVAVFALLCTGWLVGCGSGGESGGGSAPAGSATATKPATTVSAASTGTATAKPSATAAATASASASAAASATPAASGATPAASGSAKPADAGGYQANGFPTEMPKEKTAVPKLDEWTKAPVVSTKKFPDGCSIKIVREWINIRCEKNATTGSPKKISDIKDFGAEGTDVFKMEKDGQLIDLVGRMQRGKKGTATFVNDKRSYKVGFDWPNGAPFPSTIWE